MKELPKLEALSHEKKNVIIRALWDEVQKLSQKNTKPVIRAKRKRIQKNEKETINREDGN